MVLSRIKKSLNKRGIILMYHRVIELAQDPWEISVSPTNFEEQVKIIKKLGRAVQMREMAGNLKRFSFGKKEIVLTFDDGYSDNFEYAKPILEKYNVPATFFIVSDAIGSKEEFWWDELERYILLSKDLPAVFDLTIDGKRYSWKINLLDSAKADYNTIINHRPQPNALITRYELYVSLWDILSYLPFSEKKAVLAQIRKWLGGGLAVRENYLPMTQENLKMLAACPLFEVGAHTETHPMLARFSIEKQEVEIKRSKQSIEDMIGQSISSFSYPHGSYTNDTPALVKSAHFKQACTVNQAPVMRYTDPLLLPRYMVLNWGAKEFEKKLCEWLNQD